MAERERTKALIQKADVSEKCVKETRAAIEEFEKADSIRTQQEDAQAVKTCTEAHLAQVSDDLLES